MSRREQRAAFWVAMLRDVEAGGGSHMSHQAKCASYSRQFFLSGDKNRLTDIADFLLSNRFHTLKHLRGAQDPESWPGASLLSDGELALVQKLIRQKSDKSRYAYS